MIVGGTMQRNGRPVDWADLVAGIRTGDQKTVLRLGDIFQGGIRFFLRWGLGQHQLEKRQREVLSLVIQSIRETSIDDPNRLASYVFSVLQHYIDSQMSACPHLVSESPVNIKSTRAIRELLGKIADVDRETLYRYYLNQTSARFRSVKPTTKTAVIPHR